MSMTGRPYTQTFFKVQYIIIQAILGRKSMKKITVTDEKYSVFIRLLTVNNKYGFEDFPLTAFGERLSV